MHCLNSAMIVFWTGEGVRLKVNQAPRYLNGCEFGIGVITWLLTVDLEFVANMDFDGLTVMLVNL